MGDSTQERRITFAMELMTSVISPCPSFHATLTPRMQK